MRERKLAQNVHILGAKGRTRTDMILLSRDFESRASTSFATLAYNFKIMIIYYLIILNLGK